MPLTFTAIDNLHERKKQNAPLSKGMEAIYNAVEEFINTIINGIGEAEDGKISLSPISSAQKKAMELLSQSQEIEKEVSKKFEAFSQGAIKQLQIVIDSIDVALEEANEDDWEDIDFYLDIHPSVISSQSELDMFLQNFIF